MDLSSSTLKNRAKDKLRGNYWTAFAACIIITAINGALAGMGASATFSQVKPLVESFSSGSLPSGITANFNISVSPLASLSSLISFLVMAPLTVGLAKFFLILADKKETDISTLFSEFKNYLNTLVLSILTDLFTFLWSLLFIIPGIIAALGYAMAPYIIAEHPEIKAADALKMSKKMMKGNKGKLFLLDLSFIGWAFLCLLTLGIGFFFLPPYVHASKAEFFNEVSGKNLQQSFDAPAEPYQPGAGQDDSYNGNW